MPHRVCRSLKYRPTDVRVVVPDMENGRAETGNRSRRLGIYLKLLRIEENLSAAWQRLSGTYVESLPRLECAERYDRAHTFHYMAPPYWQTVGYGVDFPFDNYERMA